MESIRYLSLKEGDCLASVKMNDEAVSNYEEAMKEEKFKAIAIQRIKRINPSYEVIHNSQQSQVSQQSSGGCYVATCVYGSYDCPQVWTLRRFRDTTLASSWYGRAFIHAYYAVSPTIVKWFGNARWFRRLWKGRLDRLVSRLQARGVAATPYEDRSW